MASSSGKRWRDPEQCPTASSSTSSPTSSAPGASSASAASTPRWPCSTDLDVFVRWRPYMLDPTIRPEGLDRQDYMLAKFGPERLKTIHDPLIAAGEELGVPYDFDAITSTPNTLDAHRLIRWSHTVERQHEMAERLFMAYWSEGQDVGDRDVLARCAGEAGINAQQIRELLDSDAGRGGNKGRDPARHQHRRHRAFRPSSSVRAMRWWARSRLKCWRMRSHASRRKWPRRAEGNRGKWNNKVAPLRLRPMKIFFALALALALIHLARLGRRAIYPMPSLRKRSFRSRSSAIPQNRQLVRDLRQAARFRLHPLDLRPDRCLRAASRQYPRARRRSLHGKPGRER